MNNPPTKDRMVLRIRNWDALYETNETRKIKRLSWVPVPNKHDGKTYKRFIQTEESLRVSTFTAFVLMLELASKSKIRGVLIDEDGPLTESDMSLMTGFPEHIFKQAIPILTDARIGWIESVPESEISKSSAPGPEDRDKMAPPTKNDDDYPDAPGDHPETSGHARMISAEGRKEGIEGKKERKNTGDPVGSLHPNKRELTDRWNAEFYSFFGTRYLFQGAKDGKAADRLLGVDTIDNILTIARKAWSMPYGFNTKQAVTLAGLSAAYNGIRADVGGLNTNHPSQNHWGFGQPKKTP